VFGRILLLLMLLPVLEIALVIWIARETSLLTVVGLLVAAGVVGSLLARHQGLRAMTRIAADVRGGQMPAEAMFDALLVGLAAMLLILPGFLSDVVAILLLFPPSRRLFKALIRRRVAARVTSTRYGVFDSPASPRDQIIDVRVIENGERAGDR
jgi:UPF0716 protein FxsA